MKKRHRLPRQDRQQLSEDAMLSMRPPRILLAEDDDEMRLLLAEVLEKEGYEVIQAEDGSALLEELANQLLEQEPQEFDLVVSDIRMPGCSGLKALEGLRASNWRTPFLLITAFPDDAVRVEARRLGAAILAKPFWPSALRRLVRRAVLPTRYGEGWSASPVA
jgi:DNA-binding response OmpR family regulator